MKVLVRDESGKPLCGQEVLFTCQDPEVICTPEPIAVTAADGWAHNYLERSIADATGIMSSLTVRAGNIVTSPIRIVGSRRTVEGTPFDFIAPKLETFDGQRGTLLGKVGFFFVPLSIGSKIKAWSVNPQVAEPAEGIIVGDPEPTGLQPVIFTVVAHTSPGHTVFIIDTIDTAVYQAEVTGELFPVFIRADCDANQKVDVTDAVLLLNYLFSDASRPRPIEACNANDEGKLDITDAIYILSFLFLGGKEPPLPYPEPGTDPTP